MRKYNKKILLTLAMVLVLLLVPVVVSADEEGPTAESNASAIDTVWVLVAAFLVFFMQPGFAMLEAGFTRAKNAGNIVMKNMMDFAMGSIGYFIAGFGIMFGAGTAFFGMEYFMMDGVLPTSMWGSIPTYAFWIFQVVFAATAVTIVAGAMAERTKFIGYMIYSFFFTLLIYPTVGHWIWGGGWLSTGDILSFLGDTPMIDFAGSTVVHSVGGWAALAGAIVLGPRIGRYGKDGKVNAIPGHSITLAILGVFILWFGWFGFNPGSTVAGTDLSIATIAVTTNLAAAAGAILAMIVTWLKFGKPDVGMTGNGAIAGLVAITAPCAVVSPLSAIIIGAIAGIVVVFAVEFFDRIRVDDPVGAISVHGVCGAFGTLSAGLFAEAAYSGGTNGLFFGGGVTQLITQTIGVVSVFLFVFIAAFIMFKLIDIIVGLRVSPEEELKGLDIGEHGLTAYPDFEHIYNPLRR